MPSSLDLTPLFARPCPSKDGVFDGLDHSELAGDSFANKVKQVEMETFSVRAADFKDEEVLEIPDGEDKILNPLRTFPKGSLFLELGGGNGRFGLKLMSDGYRVVESDIAEGSVRKAKEIAERHNISNGGYAVIDAERLPFKDATFDAVFMIASFHHLPNASKAVAEIARVLKPSGKLLVLREPASWQYIVLAPLYVVLRKYLRGMNHNHFSLADDVTRGFSPRSFRKLLSPAFPTVTLHPVDYTRKIYTNWLILKMKASKKPYREHAGIIRFLEACDRGIARMPLLKSFPWDWDVTCER